MSADLQKAALYSAELAVRQILASRKLQVFDDDALIDERVLSIELTRIADEHGGSEQELRRLVAQRATALCSVGEAADIGCGTGLLAMEATARTYRYLDPAEVEERRQAKAKAAKEAKAAGGGK